MSALQQQERRATLVRVFRHHLEEERLRTKFEHLHQKWSLTPVPSAPSVVMSHWPRPKLSRASPTQRPSSDPDPRENSGVEIPLHLTVVSYDSSGPNTMVVKQPVARPTPPKSHTTAAGQLRPV